MMKKGFPLLHTHTHINVCAHSTYTGFPYGTWCAIKKVLVDRPLTGLCIRLQINSNVHSMWTIHLVYWILPHTACKHMHLCPSKWQTQGEKPIGNILILLFSCGCFKSFYKRCLQNKSQDDNRINLTHIVRWDIPQMCERVGILTVWELEQSSCLIHS